MGLEFAQMFAHFGSSVRVVNQTETFIPRQDRDVADPVRARLEEQGVEFFLGQIVESVRDHEGGGDQELGTTVAISGPSGTRTLEADAVLFATGRVPATAELHLARAGITTGARGYMEVGEQMHTSALGVSPSATSMVGPSSPTSPSTTTASSWTS